MLQTSSFGVEGQYVWRSILGLYRLIPFSIDAVRHQDYRIDEMQKRLFVLESPQQLYASLDDFCQKLEKDFL